MHEVIPGVRHWTAPHPAIGYEVSSYYLEGARAVVDPMMPAEGFEAFEGLPAPEVVVLSNRHHLREAPRFAEHFGIRVRAVQEAMHELEGRAPIDPFAFGEEVAPGVTAHGVTGEWPDEGVLHVSVGDGALLLADGVVNYGDRLGFVPDKYLGEDAEAEKRMLREAYGRLLDLEFDTLLFAHGPPMAAGGKAALREFAAG